jgi:hypothetical protein
MYIYIPIDGIKPKIAKQHTKYISSDAFTFLNNCRTLPPTSAGRPRTYGDNDDVYLHK